MNLKKLLKKVLGLKDDELLGLVLVKTKLKKRFGKYIYKKKYNTSEIISRLERFGIGKGSNVFIHSSWDAFYNYSGTEDELIDAILELIGPSGTLAMPAIPLLRKGKVFNIKKTVTKAGMLAECFRKQEGVVRSANVRHSVCAYGPLADFLVGTHHQSMIRFDEKSPFYKTCQLNFKIVSLGLEPYFIGTIIHCVEATMWKEMPYFAEFYDFNNLTQCNYIDYDGEEKTYYEATDLKSGRSDFYYNQYILHRYFDKNKRGKTKLSNLQMSYVEAQYTYERLCELARKGIVLYLKPKFHK